MLTGFEFMLSAQTISHSCLHEDSSTAPSGWRITLFPPDVRIRYQSQMPVIAFIMHICTVTPDLCLYLVTCAHLRSVRKCFTATLPPHSDFVSSCVYFHLNVLILFSHIHLSTFSRQLHVFLQILHIVATLLK